ncbi:hypothetical protein BO85DRAFT_464001 [Aspergillus piperis CBS 112811]|uniref:Uncharacterized protein n=1 Tax=Aspergillus piperis CBS 112811 TaxID=1448313 RepID=A0A8G1VIZ9_9EURO|nr:hypothetical protein BO85DRAFT_464001 [Aspergillus piperis CBS 112811]RAH52238.1 hypothetical protein BO85DRAFT_464001 [Aspergillus piperis CBS 112811]
MALKAIGCLHLPKLSSYQQRGPWGCNMDFNECRVSPTVSTGHGSATTNQTRGESGLVHDELVQTFPPHLTREVVFHPTPGNRYQAIRSLDCWSRAFLPVNSSFCTAANSSLRLNSPSSLSKFLINPPRGQIGALSPTVISLTWTSGTLR